MAIPYSGRTGYLQNFTSIEEWNVDYKAPAVPVTTSGTKCSELQMPGPKDWNGGFKTPSHLAVCIPTATASFGGSFDGSVGLNGPIIYDSLDLDWDIEGGQPIEQTVKFSANGPLTFGACVATEVAVPNPNTSLGTRGVLALATGGGDIQIQGVKSMSLKFSAKNSEYKDSDTASWTYRLPGNLSGNVSWQINLSDMSQLMTLCQPNTFAIAKLYVDGSLCWLIKYVKFTGISGIKSDRKTGAVVGATLEAAFSSHWNNNVGQIMGPSGTQFWPFL